MLTAKTKRLRWLLLAQLVYLSVGVGALPDCLPSSYGSEAVINSLFQNGQSPN